MTFEQITATIVSSLISGLLATLITLYISKKRENRRLLRQVAYDIFGSKQAISKVDSTGSFVRDFSSAMNKVPVVFCDYPKVLEQYDRLYDALNIADARERQAKADETLVTFLKELCKAADITVSDWNDSRITRVLTIK